MTFKNDIKATSQIDLFYLILFATFPIALILGNLFINLYILLFSISFFINFKENKFFFKDKIFYLLLFFFVSLFINFLLSTNPGNSFPRIIKIVFIIFFIFEIKRLIQNYSFNYIKYVYASWFFVFLILTIDILFEIIFGHNTVGIKSLYDGRVASFFGDELVAGAFYHGFALFLLSYLVLKKPKYYILIISITLVVLVSFLIGERSNFIKLFLSVAVFSSLVIKFDYKKKLFTILVIITTLTLALNFSKERYKNRYFDQIKTIITVKGYSNFIKNSHYGAHRDTAIKILKENLFFGVGVKNFRFESGKKKYDNKEFLKTKIRQSTHPHQIHYEIMSETGLFGYLSFIIFLSASLYLAIKSYLKNKNVYQLSSIIFIITSLLPLLPSGSFLSTFTSGIFWLNFAIMNGYIESKS